MTNRVRDELRRLRSDETSPASGPPRLDWNRWRVGATLSLGAVFGIAATLLAAPLSVSAGDTDERYSLLRFAPGPSHMRALPEAIRFGAFGPGDLVARRHKKKGAPEGLAVALGGTHSYCVRTCDGFFFPIGQVSSSGDLPAHAAACEAACPGAETKLFTASRTGMDGAVGTDHKPYTALPNAFAFQAARNPSCTCGRRTGNRYAAIAQDPTLRPGDAVMLGERLMVFKGAGNRPAVTGDFAEFRQEKARLTQPQRQALEAAAGIGQNEAAVRRLLQQRPAKPVREARDRPAEGRAVRRTQAGQPVPAAIRALEGAAAPGRRVATVPKPAGAN